MYIRQQFRRGRPRRTHTAILICIYQQQYALANNNMRLQQHYAFTNNHMHLQQQYAFTNNNMHFQATICIYKQQYAFTNNNMHLQTTICIYKQQYAFVGRVSFVVLPIISPVITSAVRGTKSKIACFFQKNQFDIAKEKVPSPGVRISKGWLYSIGLQARLSVVWDAWSYTKI